MPRPPKVQKAIFEGDTEALKRMARAGGKKTAANRAAKKKEEARWQEVIEVQRIEEAEHMKNERGGDPDD